MTVAESMSPGFADGLAAVVTELHYEAQTTTLRFMAGTISQGIDKPGWERRQWANTATVQRKTDSVLAALARDAEREVSAAVREAYRRGYGPRSGPATTTAARGLTWRLMDLLRRMWATWRQSWRAAWGLLIARGSGQQAGSGRRAVVQREMDRLASGGVTASRDSRGRAWTAPGYVRQAVSHQAGQAVMDGWFDALREAGKDLVIVPETATTCPLCAPWLGRILSVSGSDPEHASVTEARRAGLWHPNCQHPAQQWFPGYRPLEIGLRIRTARAELYEHAQRERAIERLIRQWQGREAAALDELARAKASRKVCQWRAALKAHRARYGSTPRVA